MRVALRGSVLKSMLGGLCLAVCALPRLAAAQSSVEDTPVVLPPPPPPPPGVNPEPQPREEAAQPPPRVATDALSATKPTRAWYGWQMLATDAISYSLIGVGIGELNRSTSDGGNGALTAGLLGYAFAPPIIHLVHGRPGMSGASLGVRILVPTATVLIGTAAENCSYGYGPCNDGAAVGLIVGFAMASAIDAGLFAWDKPAPPVVNEPQFGFTPVLSRDGKRAELRAFGTF